MPKKRGRGRPKKTDTPNISSGPAPEDEDAPKRKPGSPKKDPPSAHNGGTVAKSQQAEDGSVVKKRRGRPPKNPASGAVGEEDVPVRMQAINSLNSPSKSPGRPRGRPKRNDKDVAKAEEGQSSMEKLQVVFSDSESEESELLGGSGGAQPPSILSALTEQKAVPLGGGASGVTLPPTRKEPPLIDKFDESFDEDSDN